MNNEYDVDVFIHTWDECRAIDLYNPKKVEIDSQKDVLDFILPHIDLENIKRE